MASPAPSSKTAGLAYCENALEAIGHTPLVKLNKVVDGAACLVLAKVEYVNPGGSVKDRPAVAMLDAAERQGLLQARRDDRRTDERQHRNGPGNGGGDSRIPMHPRDARQDVARKDRPVARLRRRRRHYADERLRRIHPNRITASQIGSHQRSQEPSSRISFTITSIPEAHYHTTGPEIWEQTRRRNHAFRRRNRHRRNDLRARRVISRRKIRRFTSSAPTPKARSTPATFRARMRSKGSE